MNEFDTAKNKKTVECLSKLDNALGYLDTRLIHLHNGMAQVTVVADKLPALADIFVSKAQDGIYKALNFLDDYRNELRQQVLSLEQNIYPPLNTDGIDSATARSDEGLDESSPLEYTYTSEANQRHPESSFNWHSPHFEDIDTNAMTREQALSFMADYFGVTLQSIQKSFASCSDIWVKSSVAVIRGEK